MSTWCRAPLQASRSRPLRFSTIAPGSTYGTVVPQKRWTPADEVDVRRHVEGAALELPIFFVNRNGSIGFPLVDILRGCDRHLHNADDFATLAGKTTTHVRINVSLSLGY
jgi:protein involved in polysaccharide export with SLBB domain